MDAKETQEDEMILELYSTRMLCFMETAPQSNRYRQIILNPEEFKRFSFAIGTDTGKKDDAGQDIVELNMSEEIYPLPDLREYL